MTGPAQRDVWAATLIDLAATYPDLLVLDGDLATSTRADRFAVAHPDRFVQMGIAEQGMVGAAVGLALMGFIPWLSSFSVFFTHRAVDQVRMSVAQTNANVKIAGHYCGLQAGFAGKTHLDIADLAIMRTMPGMTVLAPADAAECAALVRWATEHQGPVFIRLGREGSDDLFGGGHRPVPGAPVRLRDGHDVLLIATGQQSTRTLAAAELLAGRGIAAGVLHLPFVKPLDAAAIAAAAAEVPLVVTTEEHATTGGLGGIVAEILGDRAPRRLVRIGIEDEWGESAPNEWLLDHHGLTPERIAARVAAEREVTR